MTAYTLTVVWSWLVFLFVWFVMGFQTKRTLKSGMNWWVFGAIRVALIVVIFILFREQLLSGPVIAESLTMQNPVLATIGAGLTVLGILFAIWARLNLGKNWGMPMSVKENPELVTSGPYRFVRHPIYTGVLTAALGSALVAGWPWLIVFVSATVYFVYSAYEEEGRMEKEFPNTYPAYKARTKRLVPFVW